MKTKQDWLKALRSGEFSQCTGYLMDEGGGYCCLGVWEKINGAKFFPYEQDDSGAVIHDSEKEIVIGITPMPLINRLDEQVMANLSEMNDGGYTFVEIALWIEENLDDNLEDRRVSCDRCGDLYIDECSNLYCNEEVEAVFP